MVEETGLALVHRGERVLTHEQQRGFGGGVAVTVNVGGGGSAREISEIAGAAARREVFAVLSSGRYRRASRAAQEQTL